MKKLFPSTQRGQALILLALAAIGLFGIAGLAIDGSAKFSDRRHAQNAADTAALAGALAKVNSEQDGDDAATAWAEMSTAALDRATDNGYDGNLVTNTVEIYNPPATGIYANCSDVHFDCNDYVQVIIDSHVNTFFARVVGINQTHNHVEAVASTISYYNGSLFGGSAVVALSPTGCALVAGGNVNTTVNGGGLYSNSDSSSCSFKQSGCSGDIKVVAPDGTKGTITSVGNMQLNSNCDEKIDAVKVPAGEKQQPFPPLYEEIVEPSACSTNGTKTNNNSTQTTTLTPGYFSSIPPGGSKTNVVLTPGIYCVGTQLKLTGSETLTLQGTFGSNPGVFIYIKPGGSQNPISLQGGDVQLWADTDPAGDYRNYLIYVAPNYASGSPTNCTINGSSGQMLRGTIYAPYCNIKLNGSSAGGFQSQLIGYTVDLSGNADVTINYDASHNATGTIPWQVGLSK